jgi:hypothetical protein
MMTGELVVEPRRAPLLDADPKEIDGGCGGRCGVHGGMVPAVFAARQTGGVRGSAAPHLEATV